MPIEPDREGTHSDDWNAHQAQQFHAVFVVVACNPNQAFGKPVDVVLVVCLSSDLQLRLSLGTLCRPLCQLLERGEWRICADLIPTAQIQQSYPTSHVETRKTNQVNSAC